MIPIPRNGIMLYGGTGREISHGKCSYQGRGMTLHLLKLCVGCDTVADLEESVSSAMRRRQAAGQPLLYPHRTRMYPKRAAELIAGGSLYWVIKGQIECRQAIRAVEAYVDGNGVSRCRIDLDPTIVRTFRQPRRPFQGWRYLGAEDAPADLDGAEDGSAGMPPELRQELAALGLL